MAQYLRRTRSDIYGIKIKPVISNRFKLPYSNATIHYWVMNRLIKHSILASSLFSGLAQAEDFSNIKLGNFTSQNIAQGQLQADKGSASIYKKSADNSIGSLRLNGGEESSVTYELNKKLQSSELLSLSFQAERWTAAKPFKFRVLAKEGVLWKEIYNGDKLALKKFSAPIIIDLKKGKYTAFQFTTVSPVNTGVLIDNLVVSENKPMIVTGSTVSAKQVPLLIRKDDATVMNLQLKAEGAINPDSVKQIVFDTTGTKHENVESYSLSAGDKILATATPGDKLVFDLDHKLKNGTNSYKLSVKLKATAPLSGRVHAKLDKYTLANGGEKVSDEKTVSLRIGYNMAHAGDMVKRTNGEITTCKRFRIPGMVTTNAGTVLAVYDLRWGQDGDLPGDLDIGLSRSEDGGKTWEAPRPIMDMGEYLGEKESKNGVGDPAILVDRKTGHIYVVGLLAHGLDRGWYWGLSKPGMAPKDTGQCIIVKSTDDGKTWSEPLNITKSIKDPVWQLMLDGPGAGITKRDGTLVFAFQFKVPKGKKKGRTSYSGNSGLLYSKDHGKTWKVSKGVQYPSETTEAQVVELNDGSLMLNCRISSGGRAVFTTKDLGETWTRHKTSGRGTFNMSGCMSSILRYSSTKDGAEKDILLFSGPADGGKKRRSHMAIRYSLDEGETWSKPYVLDEIGGAYSCLTLVENNGKKDIAIVYEGSQANMTYEVLTLEELMNADK